MSSENGKENCDIPLEGSIKMEEALIQQNCVAKNVEVAGEESTAKEESTKKPEIVHSNTVEDCKLNVKLEKCNGNSDINGKTRMLSAQCYVVSESDDKGCDISSIVDVHKVIELTEKFNKVRDETQAAMNPGPIREVERINLYESLKQSSKSDVILKHTTDSLKNLLVYDSSSSSDEEELTGNWQFRTINKSDNDSDDMSSSSSDEDDAEIAESQSKKSKSKDVPNLDSPITEEYTLKVYAENNIRDLPPIRDVSNLDIDVEKEEFLHIGHVEAVIETLITVEAIPGTPAYDLDTCLFVEKDTIKTPLGAIYDVIGPVAAPLYCIRFLYSTEITNLDVKKGMKVFCAPKSKYTRYVFVKELMKHKGTDASWVGDIELPPEIAAQLSDDECQAEPQEPRKPQKRKHGSQERHRQFEEDMNRCNNLHSHAARLEDAQRHFPRISRYNDHVQRTLFTDVARPVFDPTVPPPGFHGFPRHRAPAMVWNRLAPVGSSRSTRCHLFGHSEGNPNGYTGDDMGPGPGTSSHPY